MVEGPVFFAGWQAAQIEFVLLQHVHPDGRSHFLNQYLCCLRPEIVAVMQEHADDLFKPPVATLVKQYKQEGWDGSK